VTFSGFGEHAVDFFDGIEVDNSKAYWTDNREIYQTDVRAPMEALLAELEPEFGEQGAGFGRAKVFRPYRDVRFAKDKTPYKTHCGGVVERDRGAGAFYVQLGTEGLLVAGGCFHCDPAQLRNYRAAVAEERRGTALAALLAALSSSGWEVRGDQLRTSPRGFTADHPRIELLRHRSLYLAKVHPPDDGLHEATTLRRVRAAWRQLRPLNEWIADHVGLPEKVERRR
jgi:uncharacterized protein (TIGR02453 family)